MKSGLAERLVERLSVRLALAPVLAALLMVGCVSPPEGIEYVAGRELDDVPVKSGLEFVKSETYVPPLAEGTRFRSWKAIYRGNGLFQEIGPWYVGAMKDHGWTFTGVVESKGRYTYRFLKRDEEALIRVAREYSLGTGTSTNIVQAEVHPRGTESFLPDDFEQMKTTGVAWMEPPFEDDVIADVQTISFTEEPGGTATGPSGFLLEEPAESESEPGTGPAIDATGIEAIEDTSESP